MQPEINRMWQRPTGFIFVLFLPSQTYMYKSIAAASIIQDLFDLLYVVCYFLKHFAVSVFPFYV